MAAYLSSLEKRRIVITRAPHQAESFAEKLAENGAETLYLPLIAIAPGPEARCPENLEQFDWLILTSVNAVTYFAKCLHGAGKNYQDLHHCRIAVIGDATASALTNYGAEPHLMPDDFVSDALIEEILRREPRPQGKRVLLPQSSKARPNIAQALEHHGMTVKSLVCYQTIPRIPSPSEIAAFVSFSPDIITFFSPSAVNAFIDANLHGILGDKRLQVAYGSIGPVTTGALESARLEPVIEAPRQNEDNLIGALKTFFRNRNTDR